jgi:hypothetical protein
MTPRWQPPLVKINPPLSPLTDMDPCQKQRRPLPSERLIYLAPPGRCGRRECLKRDLTAPPCFTRSLTPAQDSKTWTVTESRCEAI